MLKKLLFLILMGVMMELELEAAKPLDYSVDVKLSPETAILQSGETFKASVLLKKAGAPISGQKMVITTKWEASELKKETVVTDGKPVEISYTSDKPGWFYCCAYLLDENGKTIQNPGAGCRQLNKKHLVTEFGAVFSPDKIIAVSNEPDDFDAFWAAERAKLSQYKMEAKLVPLPVDAQYGEIECYAIEVTCLGRAPVTGYLALPKNAKEKSLPAVVDYESMVWQDAPKYIACRTAAAAKAIALSVSWHGMETGHPAEWYVTEGKKFYLDGGRYNADDPVKWVQHDMFYRVLRALDYVKTRPEWNGKDLVTRGGSLGGIENLCAAALDKDITIAIISVPSACDYNAQASGRKPQGVYRRPEYSKLLLENPALAKSMSYHDGVNFAKRVTCETYVCTGFADESCYPSNVYSMFNAIPASTKKFMSTNPFTGHFGTTRNTAADKRISEGFNTVTVLQDPI